MALYKFFIKFRRLSIEKSNFYVSADNIIEARKKAIAGFIDKYGKFNYEENKAKIRELLKVFKKINNDVFIDEWK